ncbi:hypothetical protein, partial [Vibrio cholerae]|uniref:hypothetical protein n=1 Tax=Vibrio cholerae TaxID=666 RepID=UPI001C31542E
AAVRRALAKDPAERYADGAAFAEALRSPEVAAAAATPEPDDGTRVLTGVVPPVPVPVPAGPPSQPMRRLDSPAAYAGDARPARDEDEERRRSPWPVAIAVIVLVILAVVAALLLLGNRGDDTPVVDDATTPTSEPTTEPTTEPT